MAVVTGRTDARWLQLSGTFHLGAATAVAEFALNDAWWSPTWHSCFGATGLLDPEVGEAFRGGCHELVAERLEAFAEDGPRL